MFNTRITHVLLFFPFPNFYTEFLKRTFIERYQIIHDHMFTVIYEYYILLIIVTTKINGH